MKRYIDVAGENDASEVSENRGNSSSSANVMVSHSTPRTASCFEHITLRPGFEMIVANHAQPRGLRMGYEIERAPVDFCYNLSQRVRCTMTHCGTRGRKVLERSPGEGVLAYLPQTRGVVETPPGEKIVGVSLHFSVHTFRDLFKEVPQCLRGLGLGRSVASGEQRFYQQTPFGGDTFFVLRQILECPYHGEARRLFFEAKSLELVALKLAESEPGRRRDVSELSRRDLDLVREAYHILLDRLAHPPSLTDLSRLAGINRNKLNQGFKQLYGETVFSVLRNARLARARTLLRETDLTLSEIAFSVGYNNQANFTTAFRRHFGQTPKSVRREDIGPPVWKEAVSC